MVDKDLIRQELAELLVELPYLTTMGTGDRDAERRTQMLASGDEVIKIVDWIYRHMGARKTINRKHSSYWLKHLAEGDLGHVSNGAFIAAGMLCGYKFHDAGTNVYFNFREEPIRVAETRQKKMGVRVEA